MLRRSVARLLALAFFALAADAAATPSVRLHVSGESTCEGTNGLPTRLSARGLTVVDPAAPSNGTSEGGDLDIDVDVRAIATPGGADAQLVIRRGRRSATRSLTAPTCDEVLDALVFALALALEEPERAPETSPEAATPPPAPPAPSAPPAAPPPVPTSERPAPSDREASSLGWGAGAGAGVFSGASPSPAAAIVVHGELESRAHGLFAPSAVLGAVFVLPTSTSVSGREVAFALQMGTLDGCPLRVGGDRFALRPCIELQLGRLQSRSSGFAGARLESTTWAALALALRGRAEISGGFSLQVDFGAGSPLIQDAFSVGDQSVFSVGPVLLSATAGVGVHFP